MSFEKTNVGNDVLALANKTKQKKTKQQPSYTLSSPPKTQSSLLF